MKNTGMPFRLADPLHGMHRLVQANTFETYYYRQSHIFAVKSTLPVIITGDEL